MMATSFAESDDDDGRCSVKSDGSLNKTILHDHRLCGRNSGCNKDTHSKSVRCFSISSDLPMKNDVRFVDDNSGYQQKFTGLRWRRICSIPNCQRYLSGKIYYENWLCRKHYLLGLLSNESDKRQSDSMLVTTSWQETLSSNQRSSSKRQTKQQKSKRGDIMMRADGSREKYNGEYWRRLCSQDNCLYYALHRGVCRRHKIETQQEEQRKSLLSKTPPENFEIPVVPSIVIKPKIGDVQMVRQRWNGKKWYALCFYPTGDCIRRSAGPRSGFLCTTHFKQYQQRQRTSSNQTDDNENIPSSPIIRRRKLLSNDVALSIDTVDEQQLPVPHSSELAVDQHVQTDFTCPPNSTGLHQGFMLIDDDANDHQSNSLMFLIKREGGYTYDNRYSTSANHHPISVDFKRESIKCQY